MKHINIFGLLMIFLTSCGFPTTEKAGIRYKTTPAFEVPDNIEWKKVGLAKELINLKEKSVIISGGENPVPDEKWDNFKPAFPWTKNIDRYILIDKTVLFRSPNTKSDCKNTDCFTSMAYKGFSWVELAKPLAIDHIPKKTDILKPEKGHLVIKTIKKCQAIYFKDEIYQLSDNKGNLFVMHATETGKPSLDAVLPDGWTLKRVTLNEPLIVMPFGEKEDCYFNIAGDHLGQGYHQYKYAGEYYPKE